MRATLCARCGGQLDASVIQEVTVSTDTARVGEKWKRRVCRFCADFIWSELTRAERAALEGDR